MKTSRITLSLPVLLLLAGAAAAQPVPLDSLAERPPALVRPVTLDVAAVPLEEVLREIGRQAGLAFVFDTDLAARAPSRTLALAAVPAAEALRIVLAGTGLAAYLLPDGKVLVTRRSAAPPARPPASEGQTLRGRVVDRDARLPLPGANVVVLGTEPLLGTTTGLDGRFVLPGVPLGRHDVQVSFIGYEPAVRAGVLVTSGKEVVLEVELAEQVVQGEEVVVTPEERKERPLNDMAVVSARSFSVEETRRYAGGVDDPARMASAFAGVVTGGGVQENALVVRGNAPKGVQWRLEGVEIPNPNHFAGLAVAGGGGLTLFSAMLLADSDFFTGAFPAEYGNALSGVFDMRFRSGNPSRREHAVQLGLLGLEVASEGPFAEGRRATYLFNYRYSTLALLMPLLPTEDAIRYQDLSFKLHLPTARHGLFEAWGIGGLDYQALREEPDPSAWEYEVWDRMRLDLRLGVGAAGLAHQLVLGRRSFLRTSAAVTVNRTVSDQERLSDEAVLEENLFYESTSGRLILSSTLNHKFGARHVNRTGVTVQRLFYDLDLRAAPGDVPPLVPVARGHGTSTLVQGFTQSRLTLTPRLTLNAGVHAQYLALTGRAAVEPRAGLRWQWDARQALVLGYGLHSQMEDLRIYLARPAGGAATPNRSLGFTRAHHGVVGYERLFGPDVRLKAEVYYQRLFDVPVVPDSSYSLLNFEQDWTFDEALAGEGAGENYGAEATLERFLEDGYYYLLTGSLFESRYRGGDGRWRPTRFDQGYALNALFGKEIALGGGGRNLLGASARLVLTGGKRRSPLDLTASLAREEIVYDERRAFEEREPGLFLLDLTLTYRRNHQRLSEVWALQVKNALAAEDVVLDYNYATGTVEEVNEGYPLPVLSYKVEF